MDKQDTRKILFKKIKRVAKLCATIEKGFDPESIHKFRVEVKRLRSFFRLLASSKKEIKLPRKFKRLYDICGIIREAQLEQKKIAEWELLLPLYSAELLAKIRHQKKLWKQHYKKDLTDTLKEKTESYKINNLPADILPLFFTQHCESIKKLIKNAPSEDDIHSIRKEVKDMLYNAKFAELDWKEAYQKIKKLPLKELDKLSDMLGEYNDLRIMLEHFESFKSNTVMPPQEKNALISLCNEERKTLQDKKEPLLNEIRKFIRNVEFKNISLKARKFLLPQ